MSLISIDITGGDSAHRARMKEPESRLLKFPDGVARHIQATRWHWLALDAMERSDPATCGKLPDLLYRMATKYPEPGRSMEEELRYLFDLTIREWWGIFNNQDRIANGDDPAGD